MGDLVVDYSALRDTVDLSNKIASNLEGLDKTVAGMADHFGSTEIADAVREFGTNWDYRRQILTERARQLSEKAQGCLDVFTEADRELATKLEEAWRSR